MNLVKMKTKKRINKQVDEFGEDVKNDIDTPQFIGTLGTKAYIDFQEFCKYLSVFNPRFNIDEKVKFYF